MNEANTMADILGRNESVDEASKRLGLVAPRVTPADIEANIASEFYFTAGEAVHGIDTVNRAPAQVLPESLRLLTICILVTRNGFTVIGHSAPASPDNYRAELGRRYAKENAVRQLWPVMGYALRQRLHEADERCRQVDHCRASDDGMPVRGGLDDNALGISDAEHGRRGHVWDAERRVWREPGTNRSWTPTEPTVPVDPVPPPPGG